MFGLDDLIVGGVAGIASGAGSYFGQREANASNAKMARENMKWQERMSNTSWQRGIADMKKAGINPMLAFSKGGASQPQTSPSTSQSTGSGVPSAVNTALNAAMIKSQQEKTAADIKLTEANTISSAQQAALLAANTKKVTQDTRLGSQEADYQNSSLAKVLRYVDHITDSLGGIGGVIGPMFSAASVGRRAQALGRYYQHTKKGTIYNRLTGEIAD